MRKNEKITALYERLSRDDFGKDDDQQRESNSISNQKAVAVPFGLHGDNGESTAFMYASCLLAYSAIQRKAW